jgi:arylsulfatase A-like enzyme
MLSRRDFLKAAGIMASASIASWKLGSHLSAGSTQPNFIIILCDSLSARHMSSYGYVRSTTPYLDAFSAYSTVFHNHYSAGNYTTTATASMLTGMLPWKHRAYNLGGLVRSDYVNVNPYTLLGPGYSRLAFPQNPFPDRLLSQYLQDIDRFLPPSTFSLQEDHSPLQLFDHDRAIASVALEDFLMPVQDNTVGGTALFGYMNKHRVLTEPDYQKVTYRHGVPVILETWNLISYLNEQVYHGLYSELSQLAQGKLPYFAYFHLYSPHYPYRPRNDYQSLFQDDGYLPVVKPVHPLSPRIDEGYLMSQGTLYDRLISQIDEEFGRLIARLDKEGLLENTYLIFTSDHGELFERGYLGHGEVYMYEPVLHIPLIIHAPGQLTRQDVFGPTSNIDLLPTLLSIAGRDIPADVDGRLLPGLGGVVDEDRPLFSLYAAENPSFGRIRKGVMAMKKRGYKLITYPGYDALGAVDELYDLENDPHELRNLAVADSARLAAMKDELRTHLDEPANT